MTKQPYTTTKLKKKKYGQHARFHVSLIHLSVFWIILFFFFWFCFSYIVAVVRWFVTRLIVHYIHKIPCYFPTLYTFYTNIISHHIEWGEVFLFRLFDHLAISQKVNVFDFLEYTVFTSKTKLIFKNNIASSSEWLNEKKEWIFLSTLKKIIGQGISVLTGAPSHIYYLII